VNNKHIFCTVCFIAAPRLN